MGAGVSLIVVSDEVREAAACGRPIVALETTVVTHGLPSPEGVATALEMEADVRAAGAMPATIGVLDGRLVVGLSRAQVERLATDKDAAKLNLGNLASGISSTRAGSLTVAATMFAAHRQGIRVFATGGIGGVHRDVRETADISSDLGALARYPLAVVCSGAKSVLDLRGTRETLETLGVPVYGLGTDELPAFYRRRSGIPVDAAFATIEEAARAIAAHFDLGVGTGVVLGNPIPEEHELPEDVCQRALDEALAGARAAGAAGREVTPFLLEALRVSTQGSSVRANRALLRSNAGVAARLAVALAAAGLALPEHAE